MGVITLRKCRRCGKLWFPGTFEKPKPCPTCNTTEPKSQSLRSSVSDYMGRMRQEAAKSNQQTGTNSTSKEY